MDVKKHILFLYAETPMHVGTGVGLGAVDMPIQREKHTGYPMIQASSVKGALRDTTELKLGYDSQNVKSIFGAESGGEGQDFAGAMSPSDARILLFPVRALNGVFVWVTSPIVLARFKQDAQLNDAPDAPEINVAQVSNIRLIMSDQVMLEEYTYPAQVSNVATAWSNYLADYGLHPNTGDFWKNRLREHLIILPDNEFRDFVRYSTEIVTRIHIDDVKKTVKKGALFTQELLPADSLLYSMVHITNSRDGQIKEADEVVRKLKDAIGDQLQIGGDETVGRGRVRLNWQGVQ